MEFFAESINDTNARRLQLVRSGASKKAIEEFDNREFEKRHRREQQ